MEVRETTRQIEIAKKKLFSEGLPSFAGERLKRLDEVFTQTKRLFVQEHRRMDGATIDLNEVAGTMHPDYGGLTWKELLDRGRRMHINLPLYLENPHYYYERDKKNPTMYYLRVLDGENDEDLYIGEDGNHRTCIGKFELARKGNTMFYGVVVDEYRIDMDLMRLFLEIRNEVTVKKLPYVVEPLSEHIGREDGPGWMVDRYRVVLSIMDLKRSKNCSLSLEEGESFLKNLKRQTFTEKLFGWAKKFLRC